MGDIIAAANATAAMGFTSRQLTIRALAETRIFAAEIMETRKQ